MSAKPLRVQWSSDEDLHCAILGSMGFSTKFIVSETGLTPCQVSYRLHKGKIKRADYRNGESVMAERILQRALPPRNQIANTLGLKKGTT